MNTPRPIPTRLVPTLTEVVDVTADNAQDELSTLPLLTRDAPATPADPAPPARPQTQAPSTATGASNERDELARQVLARLMPRVDAVLEDRLLQVLTPALLELGEAWAAQARADLAATLHTLVAEAVAEQLGEPREPH